MPLNRRSASQRPARVRCSTTEGASGGESKYGNSLFHPAPAPDSSDTSPAAEPPERGTSQNRANRGGEVQPLPPQRAEPPKGDPYLTPAPAEVSTGISGRGVRELWPTHPSAHPEPPSRRAPPPGGPRKGGGGRRRGPTLTPWWRDQRSAAQSQEGWDPNTGPEPRRGGASVRTCRGRGPRPAAQPAEAQATLTHPGGGVSDRTLGGGVRGPTAHPKEAQTTNPTMGQPTCGGAILGSSSHPQAVRGS